MISYMPGAIHTCSHASVFWKCLLKQNEVGAKYFESVLDRIDNTPAKSKETETLVLIE